MRDTSPRSWRIATSESGPVEEFVGDWSVPQLARTMLERTGELGRWGPGRRAEVCMRPSNDRHARVERPSIRVLIAADEDGCRHRLLEALRDQGCLVVQAPSTGALAAALHAVAMGMLDVPDLIAVRAGLLTGEVRAALGAVRYAGHHPMVIALVSRREAIEPAPLQSVHARLLEDPFDGTAVRALVTRLVTSPAPKPAPRAAMDSWI
jgi:hypothetical protein